MAAEGTEEPTPKRKRDARQEGRIARSPEVVGWGSLLVLVTLAPWVVRTGSDAALRTLEVIPTVAARPDVASIRQALATALTGAMTAAIAICSVAMLVSLVGTLAQVGFIWTTKPLKPNAKRLNPITNLKNTFSVTGLFETFKQLLRAVIIVALSWAALRGVYTGLLARGGKEVHVALGFAGRETLVFVRLVAVVGFALGIADYGFARWKLRRELRMTRQEILDEYRQSEGDPMVKQRIRSLQRERARRRMMGEVPTASVVIVNPTHYAVALRYRAGDPSPLAVAVGTDNVAMQIRAKAIAAGVPIVEAPPLARALHRSCNPGDSIPANLYEAVAKVLAFLARSRPTLGAPVTMDITVPPDVPHRRQRRR
jgi:flagellar biosynthetic protein FlhB